MAKRTLRLSVAICLSVALSGCVPQTVTYWEGSAPGAKPSSTYDCNRGLVPRTNILFENEGLILRIGIDNADRGVDAIGNYINVGVEVPEGESAAFESDEIKWSTDIPGESRTLKLGNLSYNGYYGIVRNLVEPTGVMTGEVYDKGLLNQRRRYAAVAVMKGITPKPTPDKFYVKVPAIQMGSTKFEYPVIAFKKTTGTGIYSLTC